jgi:hypothetical protein
MIFSNKQFEGTGNAESVEVTEKGISLPDINAKLVKLENWHLQGDLATPNEVEILWGYNECVHWLRPGTCTDDILVPGGNLKNIKLRAKPNERVFIFFSYFN